MIIFHIEAWRVRRTCVGLSTVESWNCGLQWLRVVTTPGARWRRSPARVVQSNKRRKATTVESIGHCSGSSEERDRHSRWFIAGIIPLPAIRLHTATRTILIPPPSPPSPLNLSFLDFFNPPPPTGSINQSLLERSRDWALGMLRIVRFHDRGSIPVVELST